MENAFTTFVGQFAVYGSQQLSFRQTDQMLKRIAVLPLAASAL
jgi:hypothetical protein